MRVKANILKYKDPSTGEYVSIPAVTSGEDISSKQDKTDYSLKTESKNIVGAINELHDDSNNFVTKTVSDLANYYLKSETYTRTEVDSKLSTIPKFSIQVVTTLPTSGISATTVYLVASESQTDNLYTEYIYTNGKWEILGSQKVDLTGYALSTDIPKKISELTNDSGFITKTVSNLDNYYKKTETYSKTEIDGKGFLTAHQDLSSYAKKATTLSGYGITDGATKTEVNTITEKLNKIVEETVTQSDVDSLFA